MEGLARGAERRLALGSVERSGIAELTQPRGLVATQDRRESCIDGRTIEISEWVRRALRRTASALSPPVRARYAASMRARSCLGPSFFDRSAAGLRARGADTFGVARLGRFRQDRRESDLLWRDRTEGAPANLAAPGKLAAEARAYARPPSSSPRQ